MINMEKIKECIINFLVFAATLFIAGLILRFNETERMMSKTATNPVTGDAIRTRVANDKYLDNYDKIFRKNEKPDEKDICTTADSTPNNSSK